MKKASPLFQWLSLILIAALCMTATAQADPTPEKVREYHQRYEQGLDLFLHGHYADALKIFDSVIKEEPKAQGSLLMAGNSCIALFDFDKAITYMNRFLELRPDNPAGLIPLIVCYQSSGKTDKAQELIDKLRKLKQDGQFIEILGPMERFQREVVRLPDGVILAGLEYFHNDPSRPIFSFEEQTADFKTIREYQLYRASDTLTTKIREKSAKLKDATIYLFQEADYKDGIPTDPKIFKIVTELATYAEVRQWVLDARINPPVPINTPAPSEAKPVSAPAPAAPAPAKP